MSISAAHASTPGSSVAAAIAIAAAAASALSLLTLHIVSAELEPSWHMVSEYANGRHGWLLTIMFLTWGASYWALAGAIWPIAASWSGRAGLLLLILAGVGAMMGAIFDVNHRLHGAAFAIGVPSLTLATLLIAVALRRAGVGASVWPAYMVWISVVLMAVALILFTRALTRAGIPVGAQAPQLVALPPGVRSWHGWANRLVFAASYAWLISTSLAVVSARPPHALP